MVLRNGSPSEQMRIQLWHTKHTAPTFVHRTKVGASKFFSFSSHPIFREDLRLIPGMKRTIDKVPLILKKVIIREKENNIKVKFLDSEDRTQVWKITPQEIVCSWKDPFNTQGSVKTTTYNGCTVYDKLNELLRHYLDRAGTTVGELELDVDSSQKIMINCLMFRFFLVKSNLTT